MATVAVATSGRPWILFCRDTTRGRRAGWRQVLTEKRPGRLPAGICAAAVVLGLVEEVDQKRTAPDPHDLGGSTTGIGRRSSGRAPNAKMGQGAGAARGGGRGGGVGDLEQHRGGGSLGGTARSGSVWAPPPALPGVRSAAGRSVMADSGSGIEHDRAAGGQHQGQLPGALGRGGLGALGANWEPLHPHLVAPWVQPEDRWFFRLVKVPDECVPDRRLQARRVVSLGDDRLTGRARTWLP